MTFNRTELKEKILSLKEQRQAIILVHNYQLGEIQDIADFVGDSLELSQKAAQTDARVIVFCGVLFMAEWQRLPPFSARTRLSCCQIFSPAAPWRI